MSVIPIILAGGAGTRLWPLSRSAYPKQLLTLMGERTMLQDTVLRAQAIPDSQDLLIICNQEHRFLVKEQLAAIGINNAKIILETEGKNTAPAAAIAALYLQRLYPHTDPTLLVLPADHVIEAPTLFVKAVLNAERNAHKKKIVTFGIKPHHPEIGYGYIKTKGVDNDSAYDILEFVEKPDRLTAMNFIKTGQYYWNSGMFMFQSSLFLNELQQHHPLLLEACQVAEKMLQRDLDFLRLEEKSFQECPSDSIDYAVMEKTKNAVLVPLETKWSDVGSWSALWEVQTSDHNGNVLSGDVVVENVTNSYLRAESRMLSVVGVKDHIVIETPDAVLVAHKENTQDVKNIVNRLKELQRTEAILHRRVYRPWGHYETVDTGPSFQVKRITVKPGACLSLQMHDHRSEHWVVVHGQAEVTKGEETFTLHENESTYIPKGVKHRLMNSGCINLEIIEVQSGTYLGEDDITRFDDVYGRVKK